MPIVDSVKNRIISILTEDEIRKKAEEIRFYSNISAYISGTVDSARHNALIDAAAVLYFNYILHDPMNPFWDKRDRVFWSDAELAPVIYSTLGLCGYFPVEELLRLEKSGFDRFPDRFKVPGIEVSVDTSGSGLGVAVGDALSASMDNSSYQVFCIMSGQEQYLGSVWEAADAASKHKLNNLVAIVERENSISGRRELPESDSRILADRYASFGWQVYLADSSDPGQIIKILNVDRKKVKLPTVIIIDKYQEYDSSCPSEYSISFPGENRDDNLGIIKQLMQKDVKVLSDTEENKSYTEEKAKYNPSIFGKYSWNSACLMKTDFISQEKTFINFMKKADLEKERNLHFYAGRSLISILEKKYSGLNKIIDSEQNMLLTASGLAKEGRIPFIVSGGLYASEKNFDQLRNTVCLNNFNVKLVDLFRGFSDLENSSVSNLPDDISAALTINNLNILFPSDSVEAEKMIYAASESYGPVLIRIPCVESPVVTNPDTPFTIGNANIIRYRGIEEKFTDAFETIPGFDYSGEDEVLSIAVLGRMASEAMRAAYLLKEEYGIETRVINLGSVSPLDDLTLSNAAEETKALLIIGAEYCEGLTDFITASVMKKTGYKFKNIFEITDIKNGNHAELSAEYISEKAIELLSRKKIKINT